MGGRAAGGSVRAGVGGAVALSKGATGGSVGGAVMTPTRPGERERGGKDGGGRAVATATTTS